MLAHSYRGRSPSIVGAAFVDFCCDGCFGGSGGSSHGSVHGRCPLDLDLPPECVAGRDAVAGSAASVDLEAVVGRVEVERISVTMGAAPVDLWSSGPGQPDQAGPSEFPGGLASYKCCGFR